MAKSNEPVYRNLDALEPVRRLLAEADEGLKDPSRIISTSGMSEVLAAAVGAGVGGAISFATLYFAGTVGLSAAGITSGLAAAGAIVGGGMAAGIFVLAAPVAVLSVAGYEIVSQLNHRRLVQAKEVLFQDALRKRDAVTHALLDRQILTEERVKYLEALNISLQSVIRDLGNDRSAGA